MAKQLKLSYRILRIFLSLVLIISITSCDSANTSYILKTVIYGNPDTIDPQRADDDSSVSVIYNVFQGLFSYNKQGKIINGMIENYNVDETGLVWTFNLKKDVMWSDGNEFKASCTADDYVFAFERLFKPETKSERASEYYIIKNSEKINKGTLTDLSELGVKSIDEYTLQITLENTCANFAELMALPPSMPCNREYYESTNGRYGLAADCVASNGNYYVHTWSYDKWSDDNNYFILRRNSENLSDENLPTGINLFINPTDERKYFNDEVIQAYNANSTEEINELKSKFRYSEHKTEVWGIIFNQNGEFADLNYRLALAKYIDFSSDSDIYIPFNSIVPYSATISELNYRQEAGDMAITLPSAIDSKVGTLSSKNMRMIMPSGTELRREIGEILQKWQAECDFYCSIAELDKSDYDKSLANGDFDIALVKLSGEYNSPYAYLNDFISGNTHNYSSYRNRKFEHIMEIGSKSLDYESAINYYVEAEQLLMESAVFIPLCIENKYIFYSDKLNDIEYNSFLRIYE